MSFLPPTVTDLDSESTRLDAQRTEIQLAVDACTQLDALTRTQWESYSDSFDFTLTQIDKLRPNAGLSTILIQRDLWNELQRHAVDLGAWQQRLARECAGLDIPGIPPQPKSPGLLGGGEPLLSGTDKALIGGGLAVILVLALRR